MRTLGYSPPLAPTGLASPNASGGSRAKNYRLTGMNVNQATTDLGSFTGLPASYLVRRLTALNGSISLTTATVDLRTAAGGAGVAIASAAALSAITAAGLTADLALAVTNGIQSVASLVLRNVTPQGAAATCDFILEIEDLT